MISTPVRRDASSAKPADSGRCHSNAIAIHKPTHPSQTIGAETTVDGDGAARNLDIADRSGLGSGRNVGSNPGNGDGEALRAWFKSKMLFRKVFASTSQIVGGVIPCRNEFFMAAAILWIRTLPPSHKSVLFLLSLLLLSDLSQLAAYAGTLGCCQ